MRSAVPRAALALVAALVAGCGAAEPVGDRRGDDVPPNERQLAKRLSGKIRIAGPQVLQPLISAAARNFEAETPVEVEVEESRTEAALEKLCAGQIAVAGTRRAMTASEREVCDRRGIEVERLKIASHAAAVATSEALAIPCLTEGQLRKLWEPGSTVARYAELAPGLPAAGVELYAPAGGRPTFELFTALVNGREGAIRRTWRPVANRGALSARLREDPGALAFFNLAQLTPARDLHLVAVDDGEGCVEPTTQNVQRGSYPLREDLYLYVSRPQLERLRLRSFMQYLLENYDQLTSVAPSVVPAADEEISRAERRLPEAEVPAG